MRFMAKRNFKGFDDEIEIFQAGTHTDSSGATKTWTEDELDEIIANHSETTAAPLVIGHPKTDAPAYGWVESLRRVGQSLYAKFKDVTPSFEEAVQKGHFRKRSVSIGQVKGGLRLLHVGWLGAAAPALDLEPVQLSAYSEPESLNQTFEFEREWYTPNVMARMLRRLREFLIEIYGVEAADQVAPSYEIDDLDEHSKSLRNAALESDPDRAPAFSRGTNPDQSTGAEAMPFSQEDLDNARAEGRQEAEATFNSNQERLQQERDEAVAAQHTAEFTAELETLQGEGRLTPAQAEGALEFMQSLATEPAEFEFTQADGSTTVKNDRLAWFQSFLSKLPKQVSVGNRDDDDDAQPSPASFNGPSGATVDEDRLDLHNKALAYAKKHNVDYTAAARAVEAQES